MRQAQHSDIRDARQGGLFEAPPDPIDFAPRIVRRHGYSDAHSRPLVGKTRGGKIVASFRVSPAKAWRYRYLELNPANAAAVLVFDCDDPERMLELFSPLFPTGEVPDPNWISWNGANVHGHVAYCLGPPVHRNRESLRWPQLHLAAISDAYAGILHADDGYAGILARNPVARPHWGRARTQWLRKEPFSLEELAEPLGGLARLRPPSIASSRTAESRNWVTFDLSMRWAGSKANLGRAVLPTAVGINRQFPTPMGLPEVGHVAKSVEKYRAEWVEKGRFYKHDAAAQRECGLRSGKARRAAVAERDAAIIEARRSTGATHRQLGEAFGLNHRTVGYILKRAGM